MSKPTILYIAGYSRSGSTILDMLLGAHPEAVSTGELTFILEDGRDPKRLCTCGEPYAKCQFWGAWIAAHLPDEKTAASLRHMETRENLDKVLSGDVSTPEAESYKAYIDGLMSHIGQAAAPQVIVDSSKTARDAAGRALALSRIAGFDVRMLHLTRNPRSTVKSYIETGSNWAAEGYHKKKSFESWRPIFGWKYANAIARQVGRELGDDRYMHVRYENLMNNPEAELARIGAFSGLDLTDIAKAVSSGEKFLAEHNVVGNRTRLEPQTIRLGEGTTPKLPFAHDLALRAFAGAEMRALGYS